MSHACETYKNARIKHWDRVARKMDRRKWAGIIIAV